MSNASRYATPDDVCKLFPEFADDNEAFVQVWLDATEGLINLSCWKAKACAGHAMIAAHMMSVTKDGERGPVNQRTIDKISVTYAAVGAATGLDAEYSGTRYGRMYLALRSTLLIAPVVGRQILNRPPVC